MQFRRDMENAGWWWIDQGIDDKVDHFEPCELCDATMQVRAIEGRPWQEFSLCGGCDTRFQLFSALAEVRDERPINLDQALETIVDNSTCPEWL